MTRTKISETITENIFRKFYEPGTFLEKLLYLPFMAFSQNEAGAEKDILIFSWRPKIIA